MGLMTKLNQKIRKSSSKALGAAMFFGGLYSWYFANEVVRPEQKVPLDLDYNMPKEIIAEETTLPYTEREVIKIEKDEQGNEIEVIGLEKIIDVENTDFSGEFELKTGKYTLTKGEEWKPVETFGKTIGRLPGVAYFFDWDVGAGPDEETTKKTIAMLENYSKASDLTVRLGHSNVAEDVKKLFTDEKITERNSLIPRLLMGLPTVLVAQPLAKLSRSDFYNPLTQTAHGYSNIEGVIAHEIGHHVDFQRIPRDWTYATQSSFPPALLFKEAQATRYATHMLSEQDSTFHLTRYLIPAFMTYGLAVWGAYRFSLKQEKRRDALFRYMGGADIDEDFLDVKRWETGRRLVRAGLVFGSGALAYGATANHGAHEITTYAAYMGGLVLSDVITKPIFDAVIPYRHKSNTSILNVGMQGLKLTAAGIKKGYEISKPLAKGSFYFVDALIRDRKN